MGCFSELQVLILGDTRDRTNEKDLERGLFCFREMKWQMVGFVREGNMAAAIFLQPGKNP